MKPEFSRQFLIKPGFSRQFLIKLEFPRQFLIKLEFSRQFSIKLEFSRQFLIKLEFSQQILEKYSNIKLNGNPLSGRRVVPCGRTVGRTVENQRTDMTKLIVAFRNSANSPTT
jgi:hypothetical protein